MASGSNSETKTHRFPIPIQEKSADGLIRGLGVNEYGNVAVKLRIGNSKWYHSHLNVSDTDEDDEYAYHVELGERAKEYTILHALPDDANPVVPIPTDVGDALMDAYGLPRASERDSMSDPSEHTITVESVQLFRGTFDLQYISDDGELRDDARELTYDGELRVSLDCSCGETFDEWDDAVDHLVALTPEK